MTVVMVIMVIIVAIVMMLMVLMLIVAIVRVMATVKKAMVLTVRLVIIYLYLFIYSVFSDADSGSNCIALSKWIRECLIISMILVSFFSFTF